MKLGQAFGFCSAFLLKLCGFPDRNSKLILSGVYVTRCNTDTLLNVKTLEVSIFVHYCMTLYCCRPARKRMWLSISVMLNVHFIIHLVTTWGWISEADGGGGENSSSFKNNLKMQYCRYFQLTFNCYLYVDAWHYN